MCKSVRQIILDDEIDALNFLKSGLEEEYRALKNQLIRNGKDFKSNHELYELSKEIAEIKKGITEAAL